MSESFLCWVQFGQRISKRAQGRGWWRSDISLCGSRWSYILSNVPCQTAEPEELRWLCWSLLPAISSRRGLGGQRGWIRRGGKSDINAGAGSITHFSKDFIYQTFTKGAVTPFHTIYCYMGNRSCTYKCLHLSMTWLHPSLRPPVFSKSCFTFSCSTEELRLFIQFQGFLA